MSTYLKSIALILAAIAGFGFCSGAGAQTAIQPKTPSAFRWDEIKGKQP